jgi:hypothetical protein
MVLSISLHCSRFSYSYSDFKRWYLGDRSRTSSTSIVRWPAAHPVASPHLPLAAPSAVSMGDLAIVPLILPWPVAVPWEKPVPEESMPEVWEELVQQVQEMSGVDGASLGVVSIEVDGASTR